MEFRKLSRPALAIVVMQMMTSWTESQAQSIGKYIFNYFDGVVGNKECFLVLVYICFSVTCH